MSNIGSKSRTQTKWPLFPGCKTVQDSRCYLYLIASLPPITSKTNEHAQANIFTTGGRCFCPKWMLESEKLEALHSHCHYFFGLLMLGKQWSGEMAKTQFKDPLRGEPAAELKCISCHFMLNDVCSVVIKVARPCVTKTRGMTNSISCGGEWAVNPGSRRKPMNAWTESFWKNHLLFFGLCRGSWGRFVCRFVFWWRVGVWSFSWNESCCTSSSLFPLRLWTAEINSSQSVNVH